MEHILTRIEKLSKRATRSAGSEERLGKDKAAATPTDLAKQLRNSSLSDEEAKLPCIILPSIRTSRFFDRVDIIKDIENHFHKIKPEDSFQSLAIHGLGGVGKSTVALRYAEHKLQRDELDALFWVHSEKLVSIKQSFTNMAIRLKLPDAREGDHEENQALMLNWLQRTRNFLPLSTLISFSLTHYSRLPLAHRVRQCRGSRPYPRVLASLNSRSGYNYHAKFEVWIGIGGPRHGSYQLGQ